MDVRGGLARLCPAGRPPALRLEEDTRLRVEAVRVVVGRAKALVELGLHGSRLRVTHGGEEATESGGDGEEAFQARVLLTRESARPASPEALARVRSRVYRRIQRAALAQRHRVDDGNRSPNLHGPLTPLSHRQLSCHRFPSFEEARNRIRSQRRGARCLIERGFDAQVTSQ
jgi:hypothetical protein